MQLLKEGKSSVELVRESEAYTNSDVPYISAMPLEGSADYK